MAQRRRRVRSSPALETTPNGASAATPSPQETPAPQAERASAAAGGAPKPKRGRRLRNIRNVCRALADVVRGVEAGKLELGPARTMIYGLSQLGAALDNLELKDLSERIARLEDRTGGGWT